MHLPEKDLTSLQAHFAFGENWRDFVSSVDETRITQARQSLARLIPQNEMQGARFADIGCGSGLSMLSALGLGAAHAKGVDLDPNSLAATQALLGAYGAGRSWAVTERSVFDLSTDDLDGANVIYSWGVLHHTGDMWRAVMHLASLTPPGGQLVLALYHRTPTCEFWKVEKKLYSRAPRWLQGLMALVFKLAYVLGLVLSGRNPMAYLRGYGQERGMSWKHDVHDWLGGYPYESVSPQELHDRLEAAGFELVREKIVTPRAAGLFGVGCDEYVFRKKA